MVDLNNKQIEVVKAEVDRAGISFSHLQFDLIDHICCDIESQMLKGLDFEDAFQMIKHRFGLDGLQKIQEDTLLLIDKTYRKMKTTMKIFGVIAPIIISFGTLFRIEHWTGAGIMLAIGFFLLAFVFLPSAVYVSYRELNNQTRKLAHISGFITAFLLSISFLFKIQHWPGASILIFAGTLLALGIFLPAIFIGKIKSSTERKKTVIYAIGWFGAAVYITGFLFKINHWPGAYNLLVSGSLIALVIAFPMYVIHQYKNSESVSSNFLFFTVAAVWIILPSMLISMLLSQDLFENFRKVQDVTTYHTQYITAKNNQICQSLSASKYAVNDSVKLLAEHVKKYSDELFDDIGRVKEKMANVAELTGESEAVRNVLYGKNNHGEAGIIKEKINKYRSFLIQISDKKESQWINSTLSTATTQNVPDDIKTWEDDHLKSSQLINACNKLSWIQESIRMSENMVLQQIITDSTIQ
jgi:hypothetical protein